MSMRDQIAKALRDAERRAAGRKPLPDLPTAPQMVEGQQFVPGPVGAVHDVADTYMAGRNFGQPFPQKYHPIDKPAASRVAEVYDTLPMYDPAADKSYDALIRETLAQYRAMKDAGMRITPVDAATYPYVGNPRAAVKDIADKKHMAVFKSDPETSFGSGHAVRHPLLGQSGIVEQGHPMTHNDLFRAVHDYYGHAKEGYGFRGAGEDNAFRAHAAMFSPQARPAMATETRGQNSWLNYGPHGDFNRSANQVDTIYAPQKVVTMPDWVMKYVIPGGVGGTGAMSGTFDPASYGAQQ